MKYLIAADEKFSLEEESLPLLSRGLKQLFLLSNIFHRPRFLIKYISNIMFMLPHDFSCSYTKHPKFRE
jgi:hypothetical protein